MIKTDFMKLYEELLDIQESKTRPFANGYVEAAEKINLADCRMIKSDVVDIRGELEESACLDYKGVLTRVAASVLPFREGPEGKEVFLKLWRSAVYLLGGGVDINKDGTNPATTVAREAFEECNMTLSNIKDSGCSYWEYNEKPWVEKHVANSGDRWNGYYTWLFTAEYTGEGDNTLPEEGDNFRWHKVSDILARPDTKKLKFIKQAIIKSEYADDSTLKEDVTLTEGKQLGYVSYAVRKSAGSPGHPIESLAKILEAEYIKASTEEDGSKYVSLSRDLLGHLTAGSDWKCGVVLDGDKITNNYKITPVNYNSMVYFGNAASSKQLQLQSVAKYQALTHDGEITDDTFYVVVMHGSSFVNEISEATYNVLKAVMLEHNAQLAVSENGIADDKYKGRTNKDVKKFYSASSNKPIPGARNAKNAELWKNHLDTTENEVPDWMREYPVRPAPILAGAIMQKSRVPTKYAGKKWLCTECAGYNTPMSGLILKASKLNKYRDLIVSEYGVDITSQSFFTQLSGSYADEAEERVKARLINLVDKYGKDYTGQQTDFGLDIAGCIKAILIDNKHRAAFKDFSEAELQTNKTLYLYDANNEKTTLQDNTPNIKSLALFIRQFATHEKIPIILFIPGVTTNRMVRAQLN